MNQHWLVDSCWSLLRLLICVVGKPIRWGHLAVTTSAPLCVGVPFSSEIFMGERCDFHQAWNRKVDIVQNDSTDVNNYSFLCQLSSRMNDIVDIVQDFSWRCLVDSTQWFFPGEIRNSACDWVTPNKNDLRNNNHTNSWVRQESGNLGVSKVIPSLVIFRIAASHGPLSSIEIRGIKAMAIWKFTGDRDVSWGCLRFRCHWEGVKLIIPMGAGVMSFCCLLYSCCVLDPFVGSLH